MSIVKEEGILLRAHAYSESSRVLRFLTPGHGILAVMARGLRRQSSRGQGSLGTFDEAALEVSFRSHRELQTLRGFEVTRSRRGLGREVIRFWGASLVAELLLAHTLHEGDRRLYEGVSGALDRLQELPRPQVPAAILAAGWTVLDRAGLAPTLAACSRCGGRVDQAAGLFRFSTAEGGLLCGSCGEADSGPRLGPGARRDLGELAAGGIPTGLRGADAHLRILEAFALHHLAPRRPFQAVELLHPLMSDPEGGAAKGP